MGVPCGERRLESMKVLPATAPARSLAVVLSGVTIVLLAAFVAVYAIHRVQPIPDAKPIVDIGGEHNLPSYWNAFLLLLVSVGALVASRHDTRTNPTARWAWLVVATAGLYLTLDEAFELHERLADPVTSRGIDIGTYAWVLAGAILAFAGAAILVTTGRHLPASARNRLALALGIYGASAIGMEAVNGWSREHDHDTLYTLGTLIEETGEMGACILAVATIADVIIEQRAARHATTPARLQRTDPEGGAGVW
jgi:hypothetical protein